MFWFLSHAERGKSLQLQHFKKIGVRLAHANLTPIPENSLKFPLKRCVLDVSRTRWTRSVRNFSSLSLLTSCHILMSKSMLLGCDSQRQLSFWSPPHTPPRHGEPVIVDCALQNKRLYLLGLCICTPTTYVFWWYWMLARLFGTRLMSRASQEPTCCVFAHARHVAFWPPNALDSTHPNPLPIRQRKGGELVYILFIEYITRLYFHMLFSCPQSSLSWYTI